MRGAYILFAVLAVTLTSVSGQIDFDTEGCTKCPPCYHGTVLKLPIYYGKESCSYCECDINSIPSIKNCPWGMGYDMELQICVDNPDCGHNGCDECPECYEDMDYKVTNFDDPCGYCVCTSSGPVPQHCPPDQGWDDKHKKCVPMDQCCRWNDCDIECDQCYHGMQKRHANPAWACSFCCCLPANDSTTFEIGFYKECPEGQEYSEWEDKCVPSWREECQHPRPPSPPWCHDPCKDCSDVVCPNNGKFELFPNEANKCTYCCCSDWDGDGYETAKEIDCMNVTHGPSEFDPVTKVCVPSTRCPNDGVPPECNPKPTFVPCPPPPPMCEVTCPVNEYGKWFRMANPSDQCSFCCCTPDYPGGPEHPEVKSCGRRNIGGVEVQMGYDPVTDECSIQNAHCLEIPPPPPGCVSGDDWCNAMVSLCPADSHGGLLPNPGDTENRSYCQCDWGKIHWMPCAPGTHFNEDLSVCV